MGAATGNGLGRGRGISPRTFEGLIQDITPTTGTTRVSNIHTRGGTTVPRLRWNRPTGDTRVSISALEDVMDRRFTRLERVLEPSRMELRRGLRDLTGRLSGVSMDTTTHNAGTNVNKTTARARLVVPTTFDGKYTEEWNVLNWILVVERYLGNCEIVIELWPSYAYTYMAATVQAWYENRFISNPNPTWPITTSAMKTRYLPTDHEARLLRKFTRIRQLRSLADYTDQYQILVSAMQLAGVLKSETELVRQFIEGLRNYDDRMAMLVHRTNTMEEAYEMATLIRGARRMAESEVSGHKDTSARRNVKDIKRFNKLSDAAKKTAREKGNCLECGRPGHWWRNCPDLKPKSLRMEQRPARPRPSKNPKKKEKRVTVLEGEEPPEAVPVPEEEEDFAAEETEDSSTESSNEGPDSSEGGE